MKFMVFPHRTIVVLTAVALSGTVFFARAQEPPPPPAAQPPQAESSTPKSSSKNSSHIDWFLVHGTVFDEALRYRALSSASNVRAKKNIAGIPTAIHAVNLPFVFRPAVTMKSWPRPTVSRQ